jgi:hypothetical protein
MPDEDALATSGPGRRTMSSDYLRTRKSQDGKHSQYESSNPNESSLHIAMVYSTGKSQEPTIWSSNTWGREVGTLHGIRLADHLG